MKKDKHIGITINAEILEKFKYVANYDARSASGQLMHLIYQNIREFEKEHGTIELPDDKKRG